MDDEDYKLEDEDMHGVPEDGAVETDVEPDAYANEKAEFDQSDASSSTKSQEELDEQEAVARRKRREYEEQLAAQTEKQQKLAEQKNKLGSYVTSKRTLLKEEWSRNVFFKRIVQGIPVSKGVYWHNGHLKWRSPDGKMTPEQAEVIVKEAMKAGWEKLYTFSSDRRNSNPQATQALNSKIMELTLMRKLDRTSALLRVRPMEVYPGFPPKELREPGWGSRDRLRHKWDMAVANFQKDLGDRVSSIVSPRVRKTRKANEEMMRLAKESQSQGPSPESF